VKVYCISTLHPAYIARGAWAEEPAQEEFVRRAKRLAAGDAVEPDNVDLPPPDAILEPSMADLQRWRAGVDAEGATFDVECAGDVLICIGFTRMVDLAYVCVRFRRRGARPAGPEHILEARARWVYEVLANPAIPVIPHNGVAFDAPMLERVGFTVAGLVDDTMLMAHVAYPELPRGLQYRAILHSGASAWKRLVSTDDEGEGKG
jgi:hypothetical protein